MTLDPKNPADRAWVAALDLGPLSTKCQWCNGRGYGFGELGIKYQCYPCGGTGRPHGRYLIKDCDER